MTTAVRSALMWSFAERYLGLAISIASTMTLSRLLTPEQVGIYSMCAAFTAVAGILRDFGVSEYLIQERELTPEKLRAAYGLAIVIAWTIALLIFATKGWAADFYAEARVADVLSVLTLHFLLLPISSPTFALLNREMAFRKIFVIDLTSNAAHAATSVTLAALGFGVMSLAWGPIASVVAQTVLLAWMRPRETMTAPSLTNVRVVLRFGTMYVASRALEVLARNVHEPIIGKKFGFEAVGLFSRAFGLVELFNTNIAAAIIRVATPAFAAASRARQDVASEFARATAMFVSIAWTFYGYVAVMAEKVILVMFGHQWVAAAPFATVLALGALPAAVNALAPQMLSATGHVGKRLRLSATYCAVHLVCVIVASQIGLMAIAWVWLVSMGTTAVVYANSMRSVLQVSVASIYRPSIVSVGVSVASVSAQWATARLLSTLDLPPLVDLILVLIVAAASWIGAAAMLRDPTLQEIKAVVGAVRARLLGR